MAHTIDGVFSETARRAGRATHLVLTDGRAVPYAETLERAKAIVSRSLEELKSAGLSTQQLIRDSGNPPTHV